MSDVKELAAKVKAEKLGEVLKLLEHADSALMAAEDLHTADTRNRIVQIRDSLYYLYKELRQGDEG